jgi:preprotein translocase SecE subunit
VVASINGKPVATDEQFAAALVQAASASTGPMTLDVGIIRFNDILIYAQAGGAVALIAITGGLLWYLLNKPRIADFLIATEIEMRKVSWPSRREVIGSTWIVICGTLMMVGLLFFVNLGFTWFFQKIGILAGG